MKKLIDSVETSVKTSNWYSALLVVLTLPDIAGKIEYPSLPSGKRYATWFDKYVGDEYKTINPSSETENVFLSGNDCYALRCSYLHEGKSEITQQRAREVLDDFEFVAPINGNVIHCNQLDLKLQLQVDIFCSDIINGLNKWIQDISIDSDKQLILKKFLTIHQIK